MLKITTLHQGTQLVKIRLEGRIVGEWVGLLEREYSRHHRRQRRIILECRSVSYIDESGVRMFRRILRNGVRISGASALIDSLLTSR